MEIEKQLTKLLATINAEEKPNERHLEVITSFIAILSLFKSNTLLSIR